MGLGEGLGVGAPSSIVGDGVGENVGVGAAVSIVRVISLLIGVCAPAAI